MADDEFPIESTTGSSAILKCTSEIVSAFIGNHTVKASELPDLIRDVHLSLSNLRNKVERSGGQPPAVPVEKSVTDDYLICLEDGKQFKSLKRHLRTRYGLSPEEYRDKWGLPYDYPMVAPSYARQRSQLAKDMGLGQGKSD